MPRGQRSQGRRGGSGGFSILGAGDLSGGFTTALTPEELEISAQGGEVMPTQQTFTPYSNNAAWYQRLFNPQGVAAQNALANQFNFQQGSTAMQMQQQLANQKALEDYQLGKLPQRQSIIADANVLQQNNLLSNQRPYAEQYLPETFTTAQKLKVAQNNTDAAEAANKMAKAQGAAPFQSSLGAGEAQVALGGLDIGRTKNQFALEDMFDTRPYSTAVMQAQTAAKKAGQEYQQTALASELMPQQADLARLQMQQAVQQAQLGLTPLQAPAYLTGSGATFINPAYTYRDNPSDAELKAANMQQLMQQLGMGGSTAIQAPQMSVQKPRKVIGIYQGMPVYAE